MSDKQPEALRLAEMNEATNDESAASLRLLLRAKSASALRRQHAELIAKDAAIVELVEALRELKSAINFKAACITSNASVEKVAFSDDCVWKAVDTASAAIAKHGATS